LALGVSGIGAHANEIARQGWACGDGRDCVPPRPRHAASHQFGGSYSQTIGPSLIYVMQMCWRFHQALRIQHFGPGQADTRQSAVPGSSRATRHAARPALQARSFGKPRIHLCRLLIHVK